MVTAVHRCHGYCYTPTVVMVTALFIAAANDVLTYLGGEGPDDVDEGSEWVDEEEHESVEQLLQGVGTVQEIVMTKELVAQPLLTDPVTYELQHKVKVKVTVYHLVSTFSNFNLAQTFIS